MYMTNVQRRSPLKQKSALKLGTRATVDKKGRGFNSTKKKRLAYVFLFAFFVLVVGSLSIGGAGKGFRRILIHRKPFSDVVAGVNISLHLKDTADVAMTLNASTIVEDASLTLNSSSVVDDATMTLNSSSVVEEGGGNSVSGVDDEQAAKSGLEEIRVPDANQTSDVSLLQGNIGEFEELVELPAISPGKPDSYRILCGQSRNLFLADCDAGAVTVKEFVGDKVIPGLKIEGETKDFSFTKPCGFRCAGQRVGEKFSYLLPIKNGAYAVKLYFNEALLTEEGKRQMVVSLNGKYVMSQLDVFATTKSQDVLCASPTFTVEVTDELLRVQFWAQTSEAAICSAIDVLPAVDRSRERAGLPLPLHTFCSNQTQEDIRVSTEDGTAIPFSPIGKLPGNYNVYRFEEQATAKYKIEEVRQTSQPVLYEGPIQSESCFCPQSRESFKRRFFCPSKFSSRSASMFENWKESRVSETAFLGAQLPEKAVHCSVLNQTLHCRTDREDSAWSAFRKFLLSLMRKVLLPDMEFLWHSEDNPVLPWTADSPPVLGKFHRKDFADLAVPSEDLINFALSGRVFSDSLAEQPTVENSAYFTHFEREGEPSGTLSAVERMKKGGALFSVDIFPAGSEKSFEERLKSFSSHKLVVQLAEESLLLPAADVLALRSVLLQQKRQKKEWFEWFLVPGEHFLQTQEDFSDAAQVVGAILRDPEQLEYMGANGRAFALAFFSQESLLCWTSDVLARYARLLDFKPQWREGMVEQAQPKADPCSCAGGR